MKAHERIVMQICNAREAQKAEGWTFAHDDQHADGELARAASCYAMSTLRGGTGDLASNVPQDWPWEAPQWKPKDRRRDLIRAAALIVAEIERIDRAAGGNGA